MRKGIYHQHGITMWGFLFVLAFIAIVVLFTMRAFPLYNEKFQVVSAMNSVASRPDSAEYTLRQVHESFYKQITMTNLTRFSSKTLKDFVFLEKAKKKGDPNIMRVKYTASNKLFADLYLTMEFERSVPLNGQAGGE
ncbi:MAG: DUF4845 domain-containing protein [Gammaproteobacteria bacterium]|jgi:hypothetical protein|nr:MAG: DUF4845 domain-containing protein [Gammaproteobacteria bacterium]